MAQEEEAKPEIPKELFKGEVEITAMREFATYPRPGIIETIVDVTYRTVEGYVGRIQIPKKEFTEERLKEELKKELKPEVKLVGKKLVI